MLMRLVDILMAFPGILLHRVYCFWSLHHVILALCSIGWTAYARLVRGENSFSCANEISFRRRALSVAVRSALFYAICCRILLRPLLIQSTFGLAAAIVAEGSLTFSDSASNHRRRLGRDAERWPAILLTTYPGVARS